MLKPGFGVQQVVATGNLQDVLAAQIEFAGNIVEHVGADFLVDQQRIELRDRHVGSSHPQVNVAQHGSKEGPRLVHLFQSRQLRFAIVLRKPAFKPGSDSVPAWNIGP